MERSGEGNDCTSSNVPQNSNASEEDRRFIIPAINIEQEEVTSNSTDCHNDDPTRSMDTSTIPETDDDKNGTLSAGSPQLETNVLSVTPEKSRIVRSTSLKTRKVFSSTEKKIVRFADALGLDLADVRHFAKNEGAPKIPRSAFADLKLSPPVDFLGSSSSLVGKDVSRTNKRLVPLFDQPGSDPLFFNRLREQKVCLENTLIKNCRVTGVVRILNLGYEKLIQVRYTTDGWLSQMNQSANYIPRSSDEISDKFSFVLDLIDILPGDRVSFVLKYAIEDQEFWDNNYEKNYTLKCETYNS